jgi:hypothetical protein
MTNEIQSIETQEKLTATDLALAELDTKDSEQDDVVVIAKNPAEMAQAQQSLRVWFKERIVREGKELAELKQNLAHAESAKIRTTGWKTQIRKSERKITYYQKVLAAVGAGYCIIPDFPIDIFAIRTDRESPKPGYVSHLRPWNERRPTRLENRVSDDLGLPAGVGEYVSPDVTASILEEKKETDESNPKTIFKCVAGDYLDVSFPLRVAKPVIMEALSMAMKQKLFDSIGVLPARPRPDPMLVGRILGPGRQHRLHFLIAWWIDSRTL